MTRPRVLLADDHRMITDAFSHGPASMLPLAVRFATALLAMAILTRTRFAAALQKIKLAFA